MVMVRIVDGSLSTPNLTRVPASLGIVMLTAQVV